MCKSLFTLDTCIWKLSCISPLVGIGCSTVMTVLERQINISALVHWRIHCWQRWCELGLIQSDSELWWIKTNPTIPLYCINIVMFLTTQGFFSLQWEFAVLWSKSLGKQRRLRATNSQKNSPSPDFMLSVLLVSLLEVCSVVVHISSFVHPHAGAVLLFWCWEDTCVVFSCSKTLPLESLKVSSVQESAWRGIKTLKKKDVGNHWAVLGERSFLAHPGQRGSNSVLFFFSFPS